MKHTPKKGGKAHERRVVFTGLPALLTSISSNWIFPRTVSVQFLSCFIDFSRRGFDSETVGSESGMPFCGLSQLSQSVQRVMRVSHLPVALILTCLLTPSSCSPASLVDARTTLHCHVRTYSFRASKPPIVKPNGDLVTCEGEVRVSSCWGRCDSSEIGDFKMPFKLSQHPVCTYTGRARRTVRLSDCPGYPDPTLDVFDATGCACRLCRSDFTSCEDLTG